MKIETMQGKRGQWRFALKRDDGTHLAMSSISGFKSKPEAVAAGREASGQDALEREQKAHNRTAIVMWSAVAAVVALAVLFLWTHEWRLM